MFAKILPFLTICNLIFHCGRAKNVGYLVTSDSGLEENITPAIKLERFENSLYYIGFLFQGSWYQAMQFCKYHHMDLLSIETKEENEFLYNQMKPFFGGSYEYSFFTSGTNLADNHWVWMNTGRPITYFNWLPGQPNGGKEHCIAATYNSNTGLKWHDYNCDWSKLHVICEATVSKNMSAALSNMCIANDAVTVV